jgi:hypothetical protein
LGGLGDSAILLFFELTAAAAVAAAEEVIFGIFCDGETKWWSDGSTPRPEPEWGPFCNNWRLSKEWNCFIGQEKFSAKRDTTYEGKKVSRHLSNITSRNLG